MDIAKPKTLRTLAMEDAIDALMEVHNGPPPPSARIVERHRAMAVAMGLLVGQKNVKLNDLGKAK